MLIIFFYLFSDFLGLFFLTFVFSYLFLSLWMFLKEKFDNFLLRFDMSDSSVLRFKKIVSVNSIIFLLYWTFILILTFTISDIIPNITKELWNSWQYITDINKNITNILVEIDNNFSIKEKYNIDIIAQYLSLFNHDINLSEMISSIISKIKSTWFIILQIWLALILSLIFIMDRAKMFKYLEWIKDSNFSFFFTEYKIIFEKITKSFGLIFKAQSMIALTNAILTSIWLLIIWAFYDWWFPLIYTLAIIVFIAWFIPVFWTFISSVPILIIAFTIVWWLNAALAVVALILIIHAFEAYYLNPKIVSSFMELPMSLTFIILIISEHYLWVVWLIVWISIFYFVMDLFKDANNMVSKWKEVLKNQDKVLMKTKIDLKNWMRMSRKIK